MNHPHKPGMFPVSNMNNRMGILSTVKDQHTINRPTKRIAIIDRYMVHEHILAKQLGASIIPFSTVHMMKYQVIIFLGAFAGRRMRRLRALNIKSPGTKIYIWWIGTDVLNAMTKKDYGLPSMRTIRATHLCVSKDIQRELLGIGVHAELLPLVPDISKYKPWPLPPHYTVAVYMPSSALEFYGYSKVRTIILNTPDIKYLIYGNKDKSPFSTYPNVSDMGWVTDTSQIMKMSSCLLRLTQHDGFPKSVIEAICTGRYVITNHEFPFVDNISDINAIISKIKSKPILDPRAIIHYNQEFTLDKICERFR
jgi:hypothetical protein